MLDLKKYLFFSFIIFAIVFIIHLLRIILDWSLVIDVWQTPMWLSYLGLLLTGFLSGAGFILYRNQ